tara:strand:- start:501 stop:2582 length:2082 start_codon:yes stop_codon:yes gene_type:complete
MSGNYTDNGVHEQGTDETRTAYQADTPGQTVMSFIKEREKFFHEQKKKTRKQFSQVFSNPLKGYPYNEEITVTEKPLEEGTMTVPKTKQQQKALKKLLQKPLKAKDAQQAISPYVDDDGLADDIAALPSNKDARGVITKWLNTYGPNKSKSWGSMINAEVQKEDGENCADGDDRKDDKDLKKRKNAFVQSEDLEEVDFDEGYFSKIAADIEDGLNVNKIAKKYGVDLKQVKQWAAEWKKLKGSSIDIAMGEEKDPIENWLKDWGYGMKEKKGVDGRTKAFKEKLMNLGYSKADIDATMKESVEYDKPSFEEFQEKMGRMDGSILTGQEISSYFRKNPVKDKMVRKAATIALDHSGAMTYAVKKIEKLKRGLSNHKDVKKALQYANEEVTFEQIIEGFSEPQIKKLKSAYAGLKGVDPTSSTGKKLLAMMRGRPEDELVALYKADINFISLLAASNLISRFKYDSQKLVKLRKEDQEYLASNPSLFERILAERQGDVTIMDIDSKHMSNLLKALKKAQNKLGKGAKVMQDSDDAIIISNIHPVWGGSEVEKILTKLRIGRNEVDIRNESINEAPVLPSTQAGQIQGDHSVEDGVKKYEDAINKQLNSGEFAKMHKERKTEIKARKAQKFYRVETWEMGKAGSIHAFIDIANGDIFKPAGWKQAAKGARGNITDQRYIDFVAKYPRNYHGGHLYK